MARKSIAANAEKLGANDVEAKQGAVKFISEFPSKGFIIPVIGLDGKPETHTDANGNNKLVTYKEYNFTKVSGHKGKDGKVDPSTAFSFFIVDPDIHGTDYDRLLKKLTAEAKNPMHKLYTEEDHFQRRNPEAFRIAKEKSEMESAIDSKDREIAELKKKLGFK